MKRAILLFGVFVCLSAAVVAQDGRVTQGTLTAFSEAEGLGACPLKHTEVNTEISGFIARVNVKQEFENTFGRPIEAVYTFPLSEKGAVDRMTMTIGSRVIKGKIRTREEARQIYEAAKSSGKTAALLDQERPNIFTQAVANILSGETIVVEISYVETLKYEDGAYEFVFPMVVGKRYVPAGEASGDASKILPEIAPTRSGHDVSINVSIDAGVPISKIGSTLHEIDSQNFGPGEAKVSLKDHSTIPNKDFILRYEVTGGKIEDAVLTHRSELGGFFTLILQPPDLGRFEDVAPKEIVFVLDTSGSMGGFPIEKAKEAMKMSLRGLFPNDTFNLITFAGDTHILFEEPVPATASNLDRALRFLESRSGGGGTEMMKAIKAALEPSDSQEHVRIVCFMTDGYVGNDSEIIDEVKKHPNARVFSFGIGNSVNRFLLEKIAEEGSGEAAFVTLEDDGSHAARKFHERVRAPLLTDISIEWNGLPVKDLHPTKYRDLFAAKPLIINGRYDSAASGTVTIRGKAGGQDYRRDIKVDLPEREESHDALGTLWARQMVDLLTSDDYQGVQNRTADKELGDLITKIGLEFGIVTQYTSFVAVEEAARNPEGNPMKVDVPVENADGSFGDPSLPEVLSSEGDIARRRIPAPTIPRAVNSATASGTGTGSGFGSGAGKAANKASAPGPITAAVNVTTGGSTTVAASSSAVSTTVTKETIQALPANTRFSSLLSLQPGVSPASSSGGFQIDGASGSENVFLIDGQEVANFRAGALGPIAVAGESIAKPEFPKGAKPGKDGKKVMVEILVDEQGRVYSAKAIDGGTPRVSEGAGSEATDGGTPRVSKGAGSEATDGGTPRFSEGAGSEATDGGTPRVSEGAGSKATDGRYRQFAEKAALASKFTPAEFDGTKLKLEGVISYVFKRDDEVVITVEKLKAIFPPELIRKQELKEKLHFWVYEAVLAKESGSKEPSEFESRFVSEGVARIRVTLKKTSGAVFIKLKGAGFDLGSVKENVVTGTIEVGKIADLAVMDEVTYISP
ncbi:MAG: VWA domain-containing protein [Aridibacter famidurans]|nr:VWA domain-containing protein [Aridibacter famidurans]